MIPDVFKRRGSKYLECETRVRCDRNRWVMMRQENMPSKLNTRSLVLLFFFSFHFRSTLKVTCFFLIIPGLIWINSTEVPQSKMPYLWFLRRFLVFAALRLFCNMPGTQFLGLDGLDFSIFLAMPKPSWQMDVAVG